jgi:small subunit ribosomal protein S1
MPDPGVEPEISSPARRRPRSDRFFMTQQTQSTGESFADLFERESPRIKEGEVVRGRVLSVDADHVHVDIGFKSEGVIDINEVKGYDGVLTVKVGDRIEVLLERTENNDGYVVLSKEKAEKMKVWDDVERAFETGEPVLGRVIDRIKGGLKVDIGVPAFLPGSLVDVRPVRNLDALRGQEFRMRVIKVNKRRGNIVLSRKAVLEEENAEKKKKTLEDLEEGKILRGTVKNLTEYGAFIDLGGIDGLLHITDMSWERIGHPSEMVAIDQEIEVMVLHIDREKKKIALGLKQKGNNPWDQVIEKYPKDSVHKGTVVNVMSYGAFVKLEPGMVTQPDVLVVPRGQLRSDEYFVRSLLLAVETLSPSSAQFDRVVKRPHYQRKRVAEYWIVDRESRTFERWQPDDERPAILSETLVWHPTGATEPFMLDIPAFFRDAEPL